MINKLPNADWLTEPEPDNDEDDIRLTEEYDEMRDKEMDKDE